MGISHEQILTLIHKSERPFVLVNVFASWCRPCQREIPDLVALENDPDADVKVVMVSIDKASDVDSKLEPFLSKVGVNFQTYVRSTGEAQFIKSLYPIWDGRIPLTLLYTRKGRQIEVIRGLTGRAEIELIINKYKKLGV